MIPASFDYVAPTSVADALAALAEAGDDAKVAATMLRTGTTPEAARERLDAVGGHLRRALME